MTPQLRQAIKLLQFSNLEAAAFVEEELERNPLLERDDRSESRRPRTGRPRPGGARRAGTGRQRLGGGLRHAARRGTAGDARIRRDLRSGRGRRRGDVAAAAAAPAFDDDDRTIDDYAAPGCTLREHLSEQLRLSFTDPSERLIGASLIALLEPSGRLSVDTAALAAALGADPAVVASVRERLMRFDPTGMFARDLKECLAVQLAEKNRLDPAMQAMLDNLELLAKREPEAADGGVRRGCRRPRRHDRRDPQRSTPSRARRSTPCRRSRWCPTC